MEGKSGKRLRKSTTDVDPKYVKKRYLTPRTFGAFQGASSFIKNNKYKDSKKVLEALQSLKTYTLHKPIRLKHKRRPIMCSHIDYIWGSDLISYEQFSRQNGGHSYILLAVDCFSKFLFVEKIKTKNALDIEAAFQTIFKRSKRKPQKIFSDKEPAFLSKRLQDYFAKNNIILYHAVSWLHSSLAERYVGRFKRIMARIFTHNENHKWLNLEQPVATQINNSFNRAIGMKPIDVNKKNESQVWNSLYSKYIGVKPQKTKFSIGNLVRISSRTLKDVFKKSYEISWTLEVFKIKEIRDTHLVPYYKLEDLQGNEIPGTYTNDDLQLVTSEQTADD